ncbi:MAG: hypothetical protein UT20_C0007G0003 [Candidatus Levybacteria bacterium GW2011_GWA1_39_11]|nr:MAG: hypothetical protein UT20_C0007G0003 [Candidatus Levybacteria bacterium GW2011_GWA1_39_11]
MIYKKSRIEPSLEIDDEKEYKCSNVEYLATELVG